MPKLFTRFAASAAVIAAGVLGLWSPEALADVSQPAGSMPIPDGPAPSWLLADLDTGELLAERDGYAAHPPASTIKVLLALAALDELDLGSTVAATTADTEAECNCVGVVPGRSYTTRQLLEAILLVSGNDAASTLANALGGREAAVAKMNAKAAAVGATNTYATSPSGLDGPSGPGQTTPRDLAVIFRAAMANPIFAQITASPSAIFPTEDGYEPIINTNELLQRYPGAIGGKTGFTDAARKTFVGAAQHGNRRLVVALMYGLIHEGGPTYWDQAGSLLDWGFAQQPQASLGRL